MIKKQKKGGVEIRSSENKSGHNQNDQCFKAMLDLFSQYLIIRVINFLLELNGEDKFNEQSKCIGLSGDFQVISENGEYYEERRADNVKECELTPIMTEFQTSYQKNMLERNAQYFSSRIQEDLRSRTMVNGDDVIVNLPIGCNLFLDGPKDVPEYSYITFKDRFNGCSKIYIRNVLFRNINIDDAIEKEVVPLMAMAIYRFCDKSKKYGILEDEAKSEYLFSTFDKIFQKIKEMLENERLSIRDFKCFKKLFAISLNTQLENYPEAKERLLDMENTVFIVGLDQKVIDEIKEYEQEYARKKKEMEARVGHEISDDKFCLFELFGEREYEMSRAEGHAEGHAKGLVEGEQKKEKEIIFNMFSKGLDDKMISGFVPGYSVEDIANLREEWQKTNSSEETN